MRSILLQKSDKKFYLLQKFIQTAQNTGKVWIDDTTNYFSLKIEWTHEWMTDWMTILGLLTENWQMISTIIRSNALRPGAFLVARYCIVTLF